MNFNEGKKIIGIEKINELLGAIIILFTSFSPIFKTYNYGSWLLLLLIILTGINILILKKTIIVKKEVKIGVILLIFGIFIQDFINILYYKNNKITGLWYIIRIVVLYFYIGTTNKQKFMYLLERIILYINIFGLFNYTLVNIFKITVFMKKIILNTGEYFTTFGLYGFYTNRSYQFSGFTWEPSINSILLGSILLFKFSQQKKVILKASDISLIIGIFLTKSTTGYLILIVLFFRLISYASKKMKIKIIFLLIILVAFIGPSIHKKIFNIRKEKIERKLDGQRSTAARKMHMIVDFSIFKESIFLGQTFEKEIEKRYDYTKKLAKKYSYFKYFIKKNIEYQISSNGITFTLSRRGIFVFLILYFLYFKNILKNFNLNKFYYFIFFNIAFLTQEILWLPYFLMLIFMDNVYFPKLKEKKKCIKLQ